MAQNSGTLYGVGVGPGDPELMTLKAVRTIESCEVLAVPRTHGERTLALDIAAQAADLADEELLYLDFPMTPDRAATEKNHEAQADRLRAVLDAGRDAAFLTIGDASLYSTYSYLAAPLLAAGYKVVTIPGVPSFCACAAALNRSLTDMRQPLHIYPASFGGLEEALSLPGGKVLMKSGSALEEVCEKLRERGLEDRAAAVTDCGLPTQRLYSSLSELREGGYFTTILVSP